MQLNYIPWPSQLFFKGVKKLLPGHYLFVKGNGVVKKRWYKIPYDPKKVARQKLNYEQQQKKLVTLMDAAVERRLVADVPLGAFLSGGIDSSVITALAARHTPHLNTFSIGFRDEPFFDETKYANLVAAKHKTNHTVFSLTNADLYEHLHEMLDYLDEPFADSSALAVLHPQPAYPPEGDRGPERRRGRRNISAATTSTWANTGCGAVAFRPKPLRA